MNNGKKYLLFAAFFGVFPALFHQVNCQKTLPPGYPQGYFRNPLEIPMNLSANFGELRSTHWHMGLDIRTNQKEYYPVFAAADGYVSYAGIRSLSFGKFIIIRHPNGYSTLYAHLNSFFPELENFVRKKQYESESWKQELDLKADQFPVKKGQQIGLSGNTGSSQGPHLHFEIRDSRTGHTLNPLLFGFQLTDNIAPLINRLAIYNRDRSTYLQTPEMIRVIKTASGYITSPRTIITGYNKLSLAIEATDKVKKGTGSEGIYSAELFFDEQPVIQYRIDDLDYDASGHVNGHVDRKTKNTGGPYLQHLSVLPGFNAPVYRNIRNKGIIYLNDTAEHTVRIRVADTYNNLSVLEFGIRYSDSLAKKSKPVMPGRLLNPGFVNIIEDKDFEAYLPENCLFDTVPFYYSMQHVFPAASVSAQHHFGNPDYPLFAAFSLRIKPTVPIDEETKTKLVMVRNWQGSVTRKKAEWQNGWISASFDEFGIFQVFADYLPPQINDPIKLKVPYRPGKDTLDLSRMNRIVFTPVDNSGIRNFQAELDGQWLMFSNDKSRNYVYTFDERCPYGIHELKVTVEDLVGNKTEKSWMIKRFPYTPPPVKKAAPKKKTTAKKK